MRLWEIALATLVFAVLSCGYPRAATAESLPSVDNSVARARPSPVLELLRDFQRSFIQLFQPVTEFFSPVPVQLGLGIKPQPEPILALPSEPASAEPTPTEEDPVATGESFYVRRDSHGFARYSLNGDFSVLGSYFDASDDSTAKSSNASSTVPVTKTDVWAGRFAAAEEEVSNWSTDSGTILFLLGVGLLVAIGISVRLVKRLFRRRGHQTVVSIPSESRIVN